jgi:hypothetical protein
MHSVLTGVTAALQERCIAWDSRRFLHAHEDAQNQQGAILRVCKCTVFEGTKAGRGGTWLASRVCADFRDVALADEVSSWAHATMTPGGQTQHERLLAQQAGEEAQICGL